MKACVEVVKDLKKNRQDVKRERYPAEETLTYPDSVLAGGVAAQGLLANENKASRQSLCYKRP